MRFPGFIGPAYTLNSLDAGVQRCVNLYPQIPDPGAGLARPRLVGTPGLSQFSDLGDNGPVRALITCYGVASGGAPRVFAVSGADSGTGTLYELNSAGTATSRGTISASLPSGAVRLAYNETELMVAVVGQKPYRLRFSDNNLAQITAAPQALFPLRYLDGYFIGASQSDGERDRIYISALKDGNTWSALDFADADACPDIITDILAVNRELWVFGQVGCQVYYDSGNADFPFEPIQGVLIEIGCGSAFGAQAIDGTVLWMNHDERGRGVVYRADGYKPQRISTYAIEEAMRGYASLHLTQSWTYQDQGHSFYVLYFPSGDATWVYDLNTNLWHERMYYTGAAEHAHLGTCHTFAFWEASPFLGKHLVGSRADGIVYEMDSSYYNDAGTSTYRIRTFPHFDQEYKLNRYYSLELDLETGEISSAAFSMDYSDDGGHSYSTPVTVTLGSSGTYTHRARWWRLGSGRDRVFRITSTAAMRHSWQDCYLQMQPGAH